MQLNFASGQTRRVFPFEACDAAVHQDFRNCWMKGIGDVCSCTLSIERWSDQLIFQLLCSCNFGSRAQNDVWKLHEVQQLDLDCK